MQQHKRRLRKRGAGTIVKIKGKYYARWRAKGEEKYSPGCDTRDEAEALRLLGPTVAIQVHQLRDDPRPTMAEWALTYSISQHALRLDKDTRALEETYRLNYLDPLPDERGRPQNPCYEMLGAIPVDRVKTYHLQIWVDWLMSSEQRRNDKAPKTGRKAATVRRIYAYVGKLLSQAVRAELRDFKPLPPELPAVDDRPNVLLTPEQVEDLWECRDYIDDIILFAALTGLRREEICRVQWSHLNNNGLYVDGSKTTSSKATIAVSDDVRMIVNRQRRCSPFVFTDPLGHPLHPDSLTDLARQRNRERGRPEGMRPLQDYRGLYGTLLLENGADLKVIQMQMRHKNFNTTAKHYLRPSKDVVQHAVDQMADRVRRSPA